MFATKNILPVVLWLSVWLLVGCGAASIPTPLLSPLATPQAFPTPETLLAVSPLPSPTAVATQESRTPGTGSVSGNLERFDGTVLRGILVYPALIESQGEVRVAAVDPLLDSHAATDAQGHFFIDNLAPGEYALATQSPVGIILPFGTDGEIIKFKIEADSELALGQLAVGYIYPNDD